MTLKKGSRSGTELQGLCHWNSQACLMEIHPLVQDRDQFNARTDVKCE